ncbi:hypothetical protein ckrop_0926 [Corynebacterium kroppenstedtii DSM 44385]|uniref:Uncharacterized protein n=1 Tax=Corynebacterium kroppenstedtii (strain DSM 44385 / JCM 11950 / CIP 105744 / CCUG 35717) TaxID=645127 RepID=C4LIM5_CORK4|nr:hypothetical protein ckrop_0926 [Corynebacterium kroppenstedtii DSM 44385]
MDERSSIGPDAQGKSKFHCRASGTAWDLQGVSHDW